MRKTLIAALALLPLAAQAASTGHGGTIAAKVDVTPTRYLNETVVYLEHVDESKHTARTYEVDQKGMRFVPHVVTLVVGDSVKFLNDDTVYHNVYSPGPTGYFLGTFPQGQSVSHTYDKAGVFAQLCSIHPEMLAYVFVGQNDFAAVVDKAGRATLKDVPPGTYQVAVWNSQAKAAAQTITVAAGKTAQVSFSLHR